MPALAVGDDGRARLRWAHQRRRQFQGGVWDIQDELGPRELGEEG